MTKLVRSARGAVVDFDMIKIKQQMAALPKPTTVQTREDFIDSKLKRRVKRLNRTAVEQMLTEDIPEELPIEPSEFDEPTEDDTE